MPKSKELHIIIKRISYNKYVVENETFDYMQLINWFKDYITE
jgi:hypothetical protein